MKRNWEKKKIIISVVCMVLILSVAFVSVMVLKSKDISYEDSDGEVIDLWENDTPLGTTHTIKASFYLNVTGKSSRSVSTNKCIYIGVGKIVQPSFMSLLFSSSVPADEVNNYVYDYPDVSEYLDFNMYDVSWVRIIWTLHGYCVIGEPILREKEDNTDLYERGIVIKETDITGDYALDDEPHIHEGIPGPKLDGEESDHAGLIDEKGVESEETQDKKDSGDIIENGNQEESKDTEEIDSIQKELPITSVAELRISDLTEGQTVRTTGYYSDKDGGGAKYIIKSGRASDNGGTVIVLANGLYAELQHNGKVSVKQFGAHGDGVQNDYLAFNTAIRSGIGEIDIPAGTYELGGNIVTANGFVNLIGSGQRDCIVKNGCISTEYGISISEITFDGGVTQRIKYTGGRHEDGTIALFVSPNGQREVSYRNCTFKNVTVASFARENNGSFGSDVISGCTFSNIRKVAVFHSLDIGNASYTNNTFTDLGGSDILTGFVCALWIGDVSNSNNVQADSLLIEGNTFKNLITQDDFSDASHIISANFIAVRSDVAVINGNTFANLVGYGNDREAIYTKVRNLTVTNNIITNGGLGEGYLCNKSQDGNDFCVITGNTFRGSAGCAIRNFAPGTIENNLFAIDNCSSIITNTQREDNFTDKKLIIRGNTFESGTYPELSVNGTIINSYNTEKAIRISNVTAPIIIENNIFNPTTSFNQYIAIGNPGNSVSVSKNVINAVGKAGTVVYVFSNTEGGSLSSTAEVIIEKNQFDMGAGARIARINFLQEDSVISTRNISFVDNMITYSSNDGTEKVLVCDSSDSNKDCLIVQGNECNLSQQDISVTYSVDSFETDDSTFATYQKK